MTITSSQTGGFTSAPFLLRRRSRFVQSALPVAQAFEALSAALGVEPGEWVLDLLRLRRITGQLRTKLHKLLAFLDRNFATFSSRSSWPATNAELSQDASTVWTGHAGLSRDEFEGRI